MFQVFQRPNSAECKSLFEMYTALLSASKLGLSFKNQVSVESKLCILTVDKIIKLLHLEEVLLY